MKALRRIKKKIERSETEKGGRSKWDTLHSSDRLDWATPQALFDGLSKRYGKFDLDAAANKKNAKCDWYYSADEPMRNAFENMWQFFEVDKQANVFLNPPYGRAIGAWLRKAADESSKGCRVVCLVPSRTGSRWFRDAVAGASEVIFIVGRITFDGAPSPAPLYAECLQRFSDLETL